MSDAFTTEVVKDAACWQRRHPGAPRGVDPESFDRWLESVKAEAQVEALREMADALAGAEPNHLGDATEGLEFFDYGTAAEYGIDVAAAYLRNVANETAREAGIDNNEGESND